MLLISILLFSIFVIFQLIYIILPLIKARKGPVHKSCIHHSFTILVPAFNEEDVLEGCIHGLKNTMYDNFEAIIINDGSIDKTFDKLCCILELSPLKPLKTQSLSYKTIRGVYQSTLYPNVYVVDKENGGKADSLNAGIEYSSKEIIVTLDADCILSPNAIHEMNYAFNDPKVVASGGMVHIVQGLNLKEKKPLLTFKTSNIIKYQIIQYLTAFYLHKTTQATLNSITVISGAFGAFRRNLLYEVAGYQESIGEDMEITLRIQHFIHTGESGKKIIFVPDAVCYTECPETFNDLLKQRLRWQMAFLDCMRQYSRYLFKGFNLSMSIYLFFDSFLLGTFIAFPTLTIPFILLFFRSDPQVFLKLLSITFTLGTLQSYVAIFISCRFGYSYSNVDAMRLAFFIPFEVISYRLLGLLFVTLGTIKYFKKDKEWNKVERVGRGYEIICNSDYAVAEDATR